MSDTVQTYLHDHRQAQRERLFAWLRIPSISADPQFKLQIAEAADYVAGHLERIGLKNIQRLPTSSNDVVYAEWLDAPGRPTILLYGHYDVQPSDPDELWTTDPFEPVIKDGYIYGRGTSDDKGQVMMLLNGIEALLATTGKLPVNVKCFIEGDEESGSAGAEAIAPNREQLACDAVLISDTAWMTTDQPAIYYGLRGVAYFELKVTGPKRDLHSGVYGGLAVNPINVICQVLGQLRDADGKIAIPGFYDGIKDVSAEELAWMDRLPVDAAEFKHRLGVDALLPTVDGKSHRYMNCAEPTFDLCGIIGGYTGAGAKTVIASEASAKISFRLVPGQEPKKIEAGLQQFFKERMPAGVTWACPECHSEQATLVDPTSPFLTTAVQVMSKVTGKPAELIREGASIPITHAFQSALGVPFVLCGMGLPGDGIHSPNERFSVHQYESGAEVIAQLLQAYGEM